MQDTPVFRTALNIAGLHQALPRVCQHKPADLCPLIRGRQPVMSARGRNGLLEPQDVRHKQPIAPDQLY
jgi:hypothetical protein